MKNTIEARALKLSSIGYLFMAILGFYYAWQTSSEAILLDGVFSLVNFSMAILTLKVAKKAIQPPSDAFQFGLGQLEPMFNSFKGFIFLAVIFMAIFSAINSLASGGRDMAFGAAINYAAIALVGCLIFAFTLRLYAKRTDSPLLIVETQGWLIDSALSGAVLITFFIGNSIVTSQYNWLSAYLDPSMVLIMCLFMLPIPYLILKNNLFELLLISPELKVQHQLDALLAVVLTSYKIKAFSSRYIKASRSIYAHILIQDKQLHSTSLDTIRQQYLALTQQQSIAIDLVIEVSATRYPLCPRPTVVK